MFDWNKLPGHLLAAGVAGTILGWLVLGISQKRYPLLAALWVGLGAGSGMAAFLAWAMHDYFGDVVVPDMLGIGLMWGVVAGAAGSVPHWNIWEHIWSWWTVKRAK